MIRPADGQASCDQTAAPSTNTDNTPMTTFSNPSRRVGGELDVYTALLAIASLVLAAGVALMAMRNIEHSAASPNASGGVLTLVK